MGQHKAVTFALTILFAIAVISFNPIVEAKATVHSITVTTDNTSYTIGSEAIAKALLDFTGAKKDLLGVNFTWCYPNGTIAKLDSNVMPDGSGAAYSSWWPDALGSNFVVNATYTGDETKYDETSFDVVPSASYKEVSGSISVDTTWTCAESPYIVVGDVFVENGVTLTIEPGVTVEFKNDTTLTINGTIMAQGDETDMITFTSNNSNPQSGDWEGIEFNYAGSGSIISYSRIEYSDYGITIYGSSPEIVHNLIRDVNRTGIQAYKCSSYIAYNTITKIVYEYASNKGINLMGDCDVTIYRNVITDIEEYGIKITNSEPIIDENIISRCLYNIDCSNSNAIIVNNSLFDADVSSIRIMEGSAAIIANNTIVGGERKGIECIRSSPKILNNFILDIWNTGVDNSGIWLFMCKNVDVLNNTLEGNKNGIYAQDSNNSFISGNMVINSTDDGFHIDGSFGLEIVNNFIDACKNGLYLKGSDNLSIKGNAIFNCTEKGILLYNSMDILLEQNVFTSNKQGIYLQSSTSTMSNTTVSYDTDRDIYLTQNSRMISVNSTFGTEKAQVQGGCELIVKNYLHIFVQNNTYGPCCGVRINITDNAKLIYSIQTDDDGMCRFLLLKDRVYLGSNTPVENVTMVTVDNSSVFLLNNPRDVDMSFSHLEVFSPGNPLFLAIDSPANRSLVFDMLNITGSASSLSAKICNVEVNVGGEEWFPAMHTGEDWSIWWFELDTLALSDGWHVISARVSTPYHEKEVFIEILVDNVGNKPPVVTITSHNPNDMVNGTIFLEGTTFDYDGFVDSVNIRIDNGVWIKASNLNGNWSTWSINIDSTDFPDGEHNITVIAVDNATESMAINIVLVFDNADGENGGDSEDGDGKATDEVGSLAWWIALVALLIIIAIAIIFIMMRRKRGEEEEEP